ncbi:MAG: hypothetical protein WCZ89_03990 [Phycisphaerae bacterium]
MENLIEETNVLSEDKTEFDNASTDNAKLVPLAESIRYRKRAQSAEKKIQELTEQLNQAQKAAANLEKNLNQTALEQKLLCVLACEGARDIETALLVAKERISGLTDAEPQEVVRQLKQEKAYLFAEQNIDEQAAAKKTAGARDRTNSNASVLERAAQRASVSGSIADLQQYLKLRRNFI